MPCESSYLEPTEKERELRETAQLLQFVLKEIGDRVPKDVANAAADIYGGQKDFVPALCAYLRAMPQQQRERIIYDAHNPTKRRLADWWERHLKADEAAGR